MDAVSHEQLSHDRSAGVVRGGPWARGFVLLARLVLGLVFLVSAVHKVRQPYQFLSDVYGYQLLPMGLGVFVGVVVPFVELVVSVCLLTGVGVKGALLNSALLSAVFVVFTGSAVLRGLAISCGCFGNGDQEKVGLSTVARAVGLCLLALSAFYVDRRLARRTDHNAPG